MKKLKLRHCLLSSLIAFVQLSALHAATVTGLIIDEQYAPFPGAAIKVIGSNAKAITGADGRFSIETPDENTILRVTYIGYTAKEIPANSALWQQGVVLRMENNPFINGVNNII